MQAGGVCARQTLLIPIPLIKTNSTHWARIRLLSMLTFRRTIHRILSWDKNKMYITGRKFTRDSYRCAAIDP